MRQAESPAGAPTSRRRIDQRGGTARALGPTADEEAAARTKRPRIDQQADENMDEDVTVLPGSYQVGGPTSSSSGQGAVAACPGGSGVEASTEGPPDVELTAFARAKSRCVVHSRRGWPQNSLEKRSTLGSDEVVGVADA